MSYKRAILNLVFGFVFHLRFQCCHSNTNEVFDNLRYNTGVVSWVQATRQCRDSITTLVHFNPDPNKNHHNISVVKRSVHFHYDNESWVGDYSTFEVISAQGVKPNINMRHCVAMHVTLEKVLPNNTLLYEYDLVTQNCSSNIFAVCTDNNSVILTTKMTTNWSAVHRDHCRLWTPTYNTLPIAEKNTFARGNFTTAQNNGTLLNKFFWVNLIVQENNPSQLPVVGNILRCGYIAYNIPNIYYTDCFKKKAFICKTDKSQSLSSLSAGLYVGIPVTLVVVVTACVVAVIFILRKRRSLGAEKLPHGGKSFTRRNKNNSDDNGQANAGFKDENRITTYNQIDLDHMKSNPPSESSEENIDIIDNMFHPTYSIVYKKGRNENKPDVIPRNTKKKNTDVVNPGYLAMDGRSSDQCIDGVNKEYDFLESTRSTSSTRYKQIDTDTADNHVYSSTTCSISEATYDVTSHHGSSKRNPVDEDYDHVMVVTSSETMSRNMCDSIGEKTPSVNMQMSIPRSNPGYDRVVIK